MKFYATEDLDMQSIRIGRLFLGRVKYGVLETTGEYDESTHKQVLLAMGFSEEPRGEDEPKRRGKAKRKDTQDGGEGADDS